MGPTLEGREHRVVDLRAEVTFILWTRKKKAVRHERLHAQEEKRTGEITKSQAHTYCQRMISRPCKNRAGTTTVFLIQHSSLTSQTRNQKILCQFSYINRHLVVQNTWLISGTENNFTGRYDKIVQRKLPAILSSVSVSVYYVAPGDTRHLNSTERHIASSVGETTTWKRNNTWA